MLPRPHAPRTTHRLHVDDGTAVNTTRRGPGIVGSSPSIASAKPATRQQRAPRRTASCIIMSSMSPFEHPPDLVRNARHIGHTSPDASLPNTSRPSPPAGVIGRGPPARRCARRCRRLHDKRIRSKARRGFVAACQPFVDITPDVAKHASLRPSPDRAFLGPVGT
ncbi:hypothetical protein MANI_006704 [Metarhizium anisopliae]|nr:hypothetical protein MANI_006704 [Metarhizium anisopliae]